MTGPRPSIDDIVASVDGRPSIDSIVAAVDGSNPASKWHTLYQKGLLGKIEQGKSADEASALPTKTGAVLETLETPLAGVPGGALAMSAARKLVNPSQSFASIQGDVNRGTSDTKASWLGRAIGTAAAVGAMPGASKALSTRLASSAVPRLASIIPELTTGAGQGAALTGSDQLLNNDPTSTIGGHIGRGILGTGAGYLGGKVLDMGMAGGRALLAKGGEAAKDAALGTRSAVAGPMYKAVAGAEHEPMTSEMAQMLADPDVAPIVDKLSTMRQYAGMKPNDPQFLMAVRRNLSDWGKTIMKQGAVLDPSKPNLIADMATHVGKLTDAFDQAADTMVPGFSRAVRTFADESGPVNAQKAGYDALGRKMRGGLTSWDNIGKKTEGNFADVLSRVAPDQQPFAGQEGANGVLAAIRDATKEGGFGSGLRALRKAPSLLATADATAGGPAALGGMAPTSAFQRALLALLPNYATGSQP